MGIERLPELRTWMMNADMKNSKDNKDKQKPKRRETKKDLQDKISLLQEELSFLQTELKNSNARLQRSLVVRQEDQKQAKRSRKQAVVNAERSLLIELLAVTDNLKLAFDNPPPEISQDNWVKGVLGIERQLAYWQKQLGLQQIETSGKEFDPSLMEAVGIEHSDQALEGSVLKEVNSGYIYQDKVLRAAKVVVCQQEEADKQEKA